MAPLQKVLKYMYACISVYIINLFIYLNLKKIIYNL